LEPRRDKAGFEAAEARASLETSLRALGRERVELFLLHEATASDLVHDSLLEFLQEEQQRGTIGGFGIGGELRNAGELSRSRPGYARVMQLEHSILAPGLEIPAEDRIHYRGFARPARALAGRFAADQELAKRWSDSVGMDLQEPGVLPSLCLRALLEQFPKTLLLFSARSREHIAQCVWAATGEELRAPASRLLERVRSEDLGLTRELYGAG
jgi:hypothetical protein